MNPAMKKLLKYIVIIVLIPIIVLLMLIGYASITDYRPAAKELIIPTRTVTPVLTDSSVVSAFIWNIGYAGLDKNMDFFYDGGTGVRTTRQRFSNNMDAIRNYIRNNDTADIIMLQEVDVKSRRSYHYNEVLHIAGDLNNHESYYGKNYDVFFVPLPFNNPMGSVNSGLLSLTRFKPSVVERISFPGQYGWPTRLFMLDRCFLVMRFPVTNGKELLIINTHNEAYDDGSIRNAQMAYLKEFLMGEYNKGNYVLVGGDWNQCPPEFKPHYSGEVFDSINNKGIPKDYLPPEWQWVYDGSTPTNRRVDISYTRGKTTTTLIDFYLLSPNLKCLYIRVTDLGFEHSDHQPVNLTIKLN
jgi:endonuclease/exonuclease/phosphatase family metal-dependent hydrolase